MRVVANFFGMTHTISGGPGGSANRRTHTILLVERKVLIRMPLAEYLRDCGYRAIEAANGAEARAVLGSDMPVDLVFADANAPGANNGFALATWVRQHHPGVLVLLTSGVPDATAKAGELCADLLQRPYEHATVLRRIQDLLRRAGKPPPPGKGSA